MNRDAKINLYFSIASILIISIFAIYFIFAVTVQNPATDTFYNDTDLVLFNASFVNGTHSLIAWNFTHGQFLNATFYINITNVFTKIGNSSTCGINNTGNNASTVACWGYINISSIADGVYAVNATICTNTTCVNATTITTNITIDKTAPTITLGANMSGKNFSNVAGGEFVNGNVSLTATITDAIANVSTIVFFKLLNISGANDTNFVAAKLNGSDVFVAAMNASALAEGNYTLQVYAMDNYGNVRSTVNSSQIRIDRTKPIIYAANITSPVTETNYSDFTNALVTLSISALDVGKSNLAKEAAGVGSVIFLIRNATSGATNASYAAARTAGTNTWSVTINTTNFPDGRYNVSAQVNDTAGNTNTSAMTSRFMIDNTKPSATLSCSPATVSQGGTTTCTCSPTDGASGVNSLLTVYTTNPSTSSTGTQTTYCSVADLAGNPYSLSTTYSVEGSGIGTSTSSSSGGASGTSTTPTLSTVKTIGAIAVGEAKTAEIINTDFGVKEITIEVSQAVSGASVEVKKYENRPAATTVALSSLNIYKYLQIDTKNIGENLKKAIIKIKVDKSWTTANNVDKDKVAMFQFVDGAWKELLTPYSSEDSLAYYYLVEVTSFSYFAIGEKAIAVAGEETVAGEAAAAGAASKLFGISYGWWILIVLAVALVAIAVFFLYKRKKLY